MHEIKPYDNLPDDRTAIAIIKRFLGIKQIERKPQIEVPPHFPKPYVWRSNALGKSRFSNQGVAGWRSSYHRPDATTLSAVTHVIGRRKNAKRKSSAVSHKTVAGSRKRSRKSSKR